MKRTRKKSEPWFKIGEIFLDKVCGDKLKVDNFDGEMVGAVPVPKRHAYITIPRLLFTPKRFERVNR